MILLQRLSQGFFGVVTVLFLICSSGPVEQGWYYSFLSLVALITLFDLGRSVVLVQCAARQSALTGPIGATLSPFSCLILNSRRFYGLAALCYGGFAVVSGWWLFAMKGNGMNLSMGIPAWVLLNGVTIINFLLTPIMVTIEGGGELRSIYQLRLLQNTVGSVFTWISLFFLGPLWAISAMPLVTVLFSLVWVNKKFPALLKFFLFRSVPVNKHTSDDLRHHVAVTWIAGYLMTQIATPIVFRLSGPIDAGRFGLSLTIANMVALLAQSGLVSQIPSLVCDVEHKNWLHFDMRFRQAFRQSLVIFLALTLVIFFLRVVIMFTSYKDRLLDPFPFFCLFVAVFVIYLVNALALKLRSYHKEPLVIIIVITSIALLAFYLIVAPLYGGDGVALIMLIIQAGFTLPSSWYIFRKYDRELRR